MAMAAHKNIRFLERQFHLCIFRVFTRVSADMHHQEREFFDIKSQDERGFVTIKRGIYIT